jgi:hypothetical protein
LLLYAYNRLLLDRTYLALGVTLLPIDTTIVTLISPDTMDKKARSREITIASDRVSYRYPYNKVFLTNLSWYIYYIDILVEEADKLYKTA